MAATTPAFVTATGKRRTMFIPVGLPGSGKSWLFRQLNTKHFKVISQDTIKCNMDRLQSIIEYQIQNGRKHLYIDSCNHYRLRRHKLARLARSYRLQVVFVNFRLCNQTSLERVMERVERGEPHPSINDSETAKKAFLNILERFEYAEKEEVGEGISIINVQTSAEVEQLSEKLNARA